MTEEEMAKRYINLIYVVLKDLGLNTADGINDYYDVGMMGLLKGIRIYDYTKNYSPTTILFRTIRAEILNQIEKEYNLSHGYPRKTIKIKFKEIREKIEIL